VAVSALAIGVAVPAASAAGGPVMPGNAKSHGWSLTDMTKAVAPFTTSGNDPGQYPQTPFQILFVNFDTVTFGTPNGGLVITGTNVFRVGSGTPFYVPMLNSDDSVPLIGDFPPPPGGEVDYFFGASQAGASAQLIVDGRATPIGEAYLTGPVTASLLNGGTQIMTLGAFLTPLAPGTHTVRILGGFSGAAIQPATGFAFVNFDLTYTVNVTPGRNSQP
jgi:hypothetical protein